MTISVSKDYSTEDGVRLPHLLTQLLLLEHVMRPRPGGAVYVWREAIVRSGFTLKPSAETLDPIIITVKDCDDCGIACTIRIIVKPDTLLKQYVSRQRSITLIIGL